MIIIIDYNVGNLTSIRSMLNKIGFSDVKISGDLNDIETATKLILPGVGHFDYGMDQLRNAPFFDLLNRKVIEEKTPILGICLGAQLLLQESEEGTKPGLGWIKGKSTRFNEKLLPTHLRIPHMGWADVKVKKASKLLTNLPEDARFYFVHSYQMHCFDPADIMLMAEHGIAFVAGIEHENIIGVQFHPEKSHKFGKIIFENFLNLY